MLRLFVALPLPREIFATACIAHMWVARCALGAGRKLSHHLKIFLAMSTAIRQMDIDAALSLIGEPSVDIKFKRLWGIFGKKRLRKILSSPRRRKNAFPDPSTKESGNGR